MIRRPPRSTQSRSSAASDVYKRQEEERAAKGYDRYMQELGSQRLSEEEYRKSLEAKVLVEQLGNMITADVTANADEAESFYLTHKELFSHSRMVHVAHIPVSYTHLT